MSDQPTSEDQAVKAVAAWGIGTYAYDHELALLSATPRLLALYGLKREQANSPEDLFEHVHPDDLPQTQRAWEEALAADGGGNFDLIHRVVLGGQVRWVQHRAQTRPAESSAGSASQSHDQALITLGSAMDITQWRQVEEALHHTEVRFEEAVRAAHFGIFDHDHVADPTAEHLYWSPRQREIFGVSQDEPATLAKFLAGVHPDDLPVIQEAVGRAHDPKGDGYYDVEHRYVRPDGELRWLLTRSSTFFGNVGGKRGPVRTVGALIDVTEYKRTAEDHERRIAILDATPDLVGMSDSKGKLVYLNRAGRDFLGVPEQGGLVGLDISVMHTPASLQAIRTQGFPAAVRNGSWSGTTEFVRRDGAVVPMSQVLLWHPSSGGSPPMFSTIARDLSHERQLEEQMRQAQKMEAVGQLAGGVAHDFNNILSVIMGFAGLAAERIGAQGVGQSELAEISAAAERAGALTRQLLAFSRKQILRPRVVDVGAVLTEMGPMVERLVGEDIDLVVQVDPRPARVKADPHHLEQIIMNLVVNARDAMEHGGCLTVETQLVDLSDAVMESSVELLPGRYVVIAVSDNGIGMDEETQARVFEPFFTTKGPGQGTGLGLAVVFGIVKQSGGAISVYSEPGHGTTFKVYFRSSDEPVTVVPPPPAKLSAVRGGVVLIAEDDPQLRRVLVTVLKRAGFTTIEAAGPVEALAMAREHEGAIDLLLTDVVMPQMSGRQLADRVAELRPGLPVLYMSGYTDHSIVHHGVLEEGLNFLPKPVTPEQLLAAVDEVLARVAAADGSAE